MSVDVKPSLSIEGAYVNGLGQFKLPNPTSTMPNGAPRKQETLWRYGEERKAGKTAKHKYMGTTYRKKNYKVHTLVCEAFHGPKPTDTSVVIHINEDGTDNRPENLRWGTQKENLNMPKFIEYCKSRTGVKSPRSKGIAAKG